MDELERVSIYPSAISHTTTERPNFPLKIYPFTSFHFCTKPPIFDNANTTLERLVRRVKNFSRLGLRNSVKGVLLVHHNGLPYILIMKRRLFDNDLPYRLPGGRLRPGENEIQGLRRKLTNKLGCVLPRHVPDWQIGECIATWWKSDFFSTFTLDNRPQDAKECTKYFVVHLSNGMHLAEPENFRLIFMPLSNLSRLKDIFTTEELSIPGLLSTRIRFNFVNAAEVAHGNVPSQQH